MGDVIALADRDPAVLPRLQRLVDGVCVDLWVAAEETGERVPLAECVPDLYLHRIRPGGRLDRWYMRRDLPLALLTPRRPSPSGNWPTSPLPPTTDSWR
ncbi:hypothetical protein [Streptomyces sp. NPDC058548]|uniref:hypothetical protein n=1 Tax=Streptomyces sp. NPDC058548 TaxID=3346545 RepID=UPI003653FC66